MVTIIDYGTGNLRSVTNALARLGADYILTADPEAIRQAERVLLPGVGEAAAEAFVECRKAGPFISIDDMERRKVSRSTIDMLKQAGCLTGLPETSQVSLFEFGG